MWSWIQCIFKRKENKPKTILPQLPHIISNPIIRKITFRDIFTVRRNNQYLREIYKQNISCRQITIRIKPDRVNIDIYFDGSPKPFKLMYAKIFSRYTWIFGMETGEWAPLTLDRQNYLEWFAQDLLEILKKIQGDQKNLEFLQIEIENEELESKFLNLLIS